MPLTIFQSAVRSSRWGIRLASWPLIVTLQLLGLEEKTRVAFLRFPPDADEVINRFLPRGYLLFGRPEGTWPSLNGNHLPPERLAPKKTQRYHQAPRAPAQQ